MPKPTIVLVHGAWHQPAHYEPLVSGLQGAGYTVQAVELPSVRNAQGPPATFDDDVKAVKSTVESVLDANGADVAIVCHSYGGLVSSQAAQGLLKSDRQEKKNGIVHIAYLAAWVLEGVSLQASNPGGIAPEWIDVDMQTGRSTVSHANGLKVFYHDLEPAQADEAAKLLKPFSALTFTGEVSYPAWKHVDSSYLLAEKDQTIPAFVAESMTSQGKWKLIERIESSHSPQLSKPAETLAFVQKVLKEYE